MRESAQKLIDLGLWIFPLAVGSAHQPVVAFSEASSNDPKQLDKWWRNAASMRNIAVHTGGGLCVIDCDVKGNGRDNFEALSEKNGGLPYTFTVNTASGGLHYYFHYRFDGKTDPIHNSAGKLAHGVDVRGHNGFVAAPGTIRVETDKKPAGTYSVCASDPIADLPAWLFELLTASTPTSTPNSTQSDPLPTGPLEDIPEGHRNDELFKEACSLRGKGYKKDAISAALHARNEQLTTPLPDNEIDTIVNQAVKYQPNGSETMAKVFGPRDKKKKSAVEENRPKKQPKNTPREDEPEALSLRRLDSYTARAIKYLWCGWFPLHSVSILAGDPGQAKTAFMLAIASAVTRGASPIKSWEKAPKGSVVFATAEDSIDHTVLPRILAGKGDPKKFFVIDNVDYNVVDGREQLGQALHTIGDCRLLIIDPITAFMGGDRDGNSNSDVRVALRALTDIAGQHDMAVVGVSHLNKDTKKSVYARLLGSIGWVAAPRAVYLANEDPDIPGQSVVACAKTNFAPPIPLSFKKIIKKVDTVDGPADQLSVALSEYKGGLSIEHLFKSKDKKISAIERAVEWLKATLMPGQDFSVGKLQQLCDSQEFSWRTVTEAKKKLLVEVKKGKGANAGWTWTRTAYVQKSKPNEELVP